MKRKLFCIWFACVAFAYVALAAPLPSFKNVPGYCVPMKCDPFSRAALRALHAHGIPAHRVVYGWSQYGYGSQSHAIVLFQWEGKFYLMDNARQVPHPVAAKTDLGCVNRTVRNWNTHCWMVDENGDRIAPRKMADLFAPNPAWLKQLQVGR